MDACTQPHPSSHPLAYARMQAGEACRGEEQSTPRPSHTRMYPYACWRTYPNFRACFPFGKRCVKLVAKKLDFGVSLPYVCVIGSAFESCKLQIFLPMYTPTHCPQTGRKFTRAERKAANKAKFAKAQAQASASKRVTKRGGVTVTHFDDDANTRVYTFAEPKRKPASKPASKPAKASAPTKAGLMKMTKAELVAIIMATPAKASASTPKRKGKQASAKATPSTRVADKQDKAFHGRPDTPVTPKHEPVGADVEQARKSAREQGLRNRLNHAMKLATDWAFKGAYGGMYTKEQQAELTRLTGSTNVATYEDVMAVCM